ncbi:MgtC/SapB family protein [Ideonella sp.]|uniref:MgtC/SapB family protein n=1 Tax=Ideonella sp. TaxID=1929293 RepID=UPI0035AEB343
MSLELARSFLAALLIGILVGIEREKKRHTEPSHTIGGIRTHALLALAGGASAWLARELQIAGIFLVMLGAVGAMAVTSLVRRGRDGQDEAPGMTSEIAAMAVVLLGAMAVVGNQALAVALAVAVSAVLAYKEPMHELVRRVGVDDILAVLKLLIASVIVLPLVPDELVDPWKAINPYQLWLLVVLISALSLAGYVGMRWLGPARGTAVTGLAGGLVSSTATTLSFARDSRAGTPFTSDAISAGILLAWLVMFLRVTVIVAIVNQQLLQVVWPPLMVMAAVTGAFAARHYLAGAAAATTTADHPIVVKNPFSLSAAIRFGALFAVVLVIVKLAQQHLPSAGLYAVSALAGAADVDAIVLSLASDGRTAPPGAEQAAVALLLALAANTVVKLATVVILGRGPVRRHVAIATVCIAAAGGASAMAWI